MDIRVFVDFDGTITEEDTLCFLLDHYAGPGWLEIEKKVEDGRYSEERGLQEEISMIRASWEEARDLVLSKIAVDPEFAPFVTACAERNWPLEILSGGLFPLIRAVLEREDIFGLTVRANDLDVNSALRWSVQPALSPRIKKQCNHCKSHWLVTARESGQRVIYIGDGTTDRCPATHADLVFAKDGLKTWCGENGIACIEFTTFGDIRDWLSSEEGLAWIEMSPPVKNG
ncbi:MAG: MtnX-like HAD-IB family phosphatase [bacterium]|nr:MtnX-like HAD-IB family phosphatase [bacterium]